LPDQQAVDLRHKVVAIAISIHLQLVKQWSNLKSTFGLTSGQPSVNLGQRHQPTADNHQSLQDANTKPQLTLQSNHAP
jgi:hypothetical protein